MRQRVPALSRNDDQSCLLVASITSQYTARRVSNAAHTDTLVTEATTIASGLGLRRGVTALQLQ